MAIIVRSKETRRKYVLLGTGYGAFRSTRHGRMWAGQTSATEADQHEMIAVCDPDGRIFWLPSAHVEVLTVDGEKPSELLGNPAPPAAPC